MSKQTKKNLRNTQSRESVGREDARTQPRAAAAETYGGVNVADPARAFEIPDRVWVWLNLAVLFVAVALRIYALGLRPLHHDEGVNGFFLTNLVRQGRYVYDPANYHGPTLYYLTVPLTALFGLQTWVLRALPVLFGMGTVALLLSLHRRIGRTGALVAGALIAVSPGAIFFSRYYIHEMPFVFFTLAAVVLWLRFAETRRSVHLMFCALSLALLFATKETAFISLGVLLIAGVMTHLYLHLMGDYWRASSNAKGKKRSTSSKWKTTLDSFALEVRALGGSKQLLPLIGIGIVLFILVNVVLYSSFFTNPKGITDSVATFAVWQRTGTSDFHAKSFWMYFKWLGKEETALTLVGACGALWAAWRADNRFAVFSALWAGGIILAYSLVPYKTPWLALNFLPPLAITGGYLFQTLAAKTRAGVNPDDAADDAIATSRPLRLASHIALAAALAVGAYRAIALNFVHYDDDSFAYVYAHSTRDLTTLDAEVKRLVARGGASATISIHSTDYWPLPWYFRDYKVVGYPPQQLAKATASLLILSSAQVDEAERVLGARYTETGRYRLRPGVEVVLFVKRELAG